MDLPIEECFNTGFEDVGILTTSSGNKEISFHLVDKYQTEKLYGMIIEGTAPIACCMTKDLAGVDHSSTLEISNTVYHVNEIMPIDKYETLLKLSYD